MPLSGFILSELLREPGEPAPVNERFGPPRTSSTAGKI